ncbi:aromatase/cyclase [Actinomadura sp. 7K507]|uniref:aromatase/cyclase n=1 Tax=Actinomadura sp. 7K507 TaxID=2530365 RepID=UPI001046B6C6|nr:aromatase/cyclase [Actinomadura sp. 7K507]TDC97196.1 cyclase [Actinomadura sp. 7K507]
MAPPDTREVEHEITVRAPASEVYRLIAEVENWPRIFPPTVYVDPEERHGKDERIRIWATANGEAKNWTSRRRLDPDALRIDFRQEVSRPPVAAMGGAWVVEPSADGGAPETRVRLLHDYRAEDDDPEKLAWIDRAVDGNSHAELAALKAHAELDPESGGLLTFSDEVRVDGPAEDVYDFLNEAQHWPRRLPHVEKVSLQEETPGQQLLTMDTRTKDGSVHSTTSVRVCMPHTRIVYKQIHVPPLMTMHTGEWELIPDDGGVRVVSWHTVKINEANVTKILGGGAGLPDARDYVRSALSANSLTTLRHAKEHAERRG